MIDRENAPLANKLANRILGMSAPRVHMRQTNAETKPTKQQPRHHRQIQRTVLRNWFLYLRITQGRIVISDAQAQPACRTLLMEEKTPR
ncbi:hypothetical protein EMCG_00314 [[Emmonsia] crescens]|uniref:Uncharacterized protein n=1 Tax=[Emmonsia] crescens TaxID=73230 RepID=A0A0G2HX03_9EURO|nr:hypothetical protein EMCG_00314 [Emmonsia crescens UAMH 3008]